MHKKTVHLGEKEFKCDACEKSFIYMRALNLHTEAVHLGLKPYFCTKCPYKSGWESDMNRHLHQMDNAATSEKK